MDTKWKNTKKVISFLSFFLGVSLALRSAVCIVRCMPDGISLKNMDQLLEEDYQKSSDFRGYISDRLEAFLMMAGGNLPGWLNEYRYYPYAGTAYSYIFLDPILQETEEVYAEEIQELWVDPLTEGTEYGGQDESVSVEDEASRLAEQQKKELIERYHNKIKEDKNLLYSISKDGQVLYANTDFFQTDEVLLPPEGYNFLLVFDGQKVRIVKDGEELDVYGDGYYREDNDWYVPGYRNFPAGSDISDTVVCIAAAKEPLLYTQTYGSNGYQQPGCYLYWLQKNYADRRRQLAGNAVTLALSLSLLIQYAFFFRRIGRENAKGIARIQGKIWIECKLLALIVIFALLFRAHYYSDYYGYYYLFEEIAYSYEYDFSYGATALLDCVKLFLGSLPASFLPILFWMIWLTVNDLRYNKKEVWRQGLFPKLYRTFTAREMKQPLARRLAHRNGLLFGAAIFYGLVLTALTISACSGEWYRHEWGVAMLCILAILGFLLAVYTVSVKNMKAAREIDLLSERISAIRDGDYRDSSSDTAAGQKDPAEQYACDLSDTMAQLDDIRHGMANAVDEQMKSERMKVELIANVSHDIKTPLTSIISYVQFLKEEENLPEHVKDYVKILDEKSQRLKNMVQDVFAVSKAASGELPLHMEVLDFGKLLRQTMADMDEQIRESRVTFRTEIPEKPILITADGERLYRVFQNLFQNALKYSLDGSRVYIALKEEGVMAVASVKNTSHIELEKDKNFTERFVRGDKSRTDGGSGLGLSIAQSFTEACGGQFALEFDADLFIVKISFPVQENL